MNQKMKIPLNELQRKADSIKRLTDDIINERISLPDNALVTDFNAALSVITKKRLELIESIERYQPKSVQELANITKRKKQAVDWDLKILERFEIIELKKMGRTVIPIIKHEVIILNLKKPVLQKQEIVLADVYVDSQNINQHLMEIPA